MSIDSDRYVYFWLITYYLLIFERAQVWCVNIDTIMPKSLKSAYVICLYSKNTVGKSVFLGRTVRCIKNVFYSHFESQILFRVTFYSDNYGLGESHCKWTSGVKWTISTWTAWFFSNLGGMGHSRYLTSSPGSGT